MREERTVLVLLIFLRENIEKYWGQPVPVSNTGIYEDTVIDGLCNYITALMVTDKITKTEMTRVEEYVCSHKPKETDSKEWWWTKGELFPRIEFLDMLIQKKLKEDTSPSDEVIKEVIKLFELAGYKRINEKETDYRMLMFERTPHNYKIVYYVNKGTAIQHAMWKILELERQLGYELAFQKIKSKLLKFIDDGEDKKFTK